MKKVYCVNCKHYEKSNFLSRGGNNCNHPDNIKYENIEENYLKPNHYRFSGWQKTPEELNKNNDCKYYDEK